MINNNNYKHKLTISPTQAIFYLYSVETPEFADKKKVLAQWLICGLKEQANNSRFESLIKAHLPEEYIVSYLPAIINTDPVRRVFENHLAQSLLTKALDSINVKDLKNYLRTLLDFFAPNFRADIENRINNNIHPIAGRPYNITIPKDYIDLYVKLKNKRFNLFSDGAQHEKRLLITKISIVVSQLVNNSEQLATKIYNEAPFTDPDKARTYKEKYSTVFSRNLGLLRSYMPHGYYGDFKIEKQEYPRAADIYGYRDQFQASELFSHKVHPFSASISGTMLMHIKCLYISEKLSRGSLHFPGKLFFENYFLAVSSLFLIHDGGHSFYEFFEPFKLINVQQLLPIEFKDFSGGMEHFIMKNQADCVREAMGKTQFYHQHILRRSKLMMSLSIMEKGDADAAFYSISSVLGQRSDVKITVERIAARFQNCSPPKTAQIVHANPKMGLFFELLRFIIIEKAKTRMTDFNFYNNSIVLLAYNIMLGLIIKVAPLKRFEPHGNEILSSIMSRFEQVRFEQLSGLYLLSSK
jgi:hypothetical protein